MLARSDKAQRSIGALWFAAWAMLAAGLMYWLPALESGGFGVSMLILVPGISALPAGALLGPTLLRGRSLGHLKALGLGVLAVLLTYVCFAPLFTLGFWIADPEGTRFVGMLVATWMLSIPMTGVVALPIGAIAGWLLFLIGGTRDAGLASFPHSASPNSGEVSQ